jgi:hypothetical protein
LFERLPRRRRNKNSYLGEAPLGGAIIEGGHARARKNGNRHLGAFWR